jgi:hypothetical protein
MDINNNFDELAIHSFLNLTMISEDALELKC